MRPTGAWAILVALTLAGAGCSAGAPAPTAIPPPAIAPATPQVSPSLPSPSGSSGSSPADQQAAVDAALRDAATHLGVSASALHVERVEARQWGDSSLGCPRPGLMYSQVVTPGLLIIISGAGKTLEYHTDSRDRVVLCQES